jgi:hypothetical protein
MSSTGAVVSGAVRRKGISSGQLLINGKWKDRVAPLETCWQLGTRRSTLPRTVQFA